MRRTPSGHVLSYSGLSEMIHVVHHVEAQSAANRRDQASECTGTLQRLLSR